MQNGIIIYWSESQEIVEFDCNQFESIESVQSSKELWDSGDSYEYHISPRIIGTTDEGIEVEIHYKKSINSHIPPTEISWGVSKLKLNHNSYSGKASWTDDDEPSQNGTCHWVRLDSPLKSTKRRKITTTKLQRDQSKFRKLLLKYDNKCVISGEELGLVLEAAHIIPVSEGGPDIPSNGFMLRSDIHKLYDANIFKITPDGEIIVDASICSSDYVQLLHNKQLSYTTLSRVKNALVEKAY